MASHEWEGNTLDSLLEATNMEKFLRKPSTSSIQSSHNGLRNLISEYLPDVHNNQEPYAHPCFICGSVGIFHD
jgi:hypothetical protein